MIKNDIIQNNNNFIHISYDNEFKNTNVKLESKKRYIRSFTDNDLDLTVVEILDEDNIPENYFLFPESKTMINKKLINKQGQYDIYTTIC